MATWGEFMAEVRVQKQKPGGMVVPVDDVLTIWEERNQLRKEVAQLKDYLTQEREACARDVDEFADAVAAEPEQPEYLVPVLRAAATLIRERSQDQVEEEVDAAPETAVVPAVEAASTEETE